MAKLAGFFFRPEIVGSEEMKTPRKVLPVQLIALSGRCVEVVLLILIRNPAMWKVPTVFAATLFTKRIDFVRLGVSKAARGDARILYRQIESVYVYIYNILITMVNDMETWDVFFLTWQNLLFASDRCFLISLSILDYTAPEMILDVAW